MDSVMSWQDAFRKLPFRFLGYGMAVGESVRGVPEGPDPNLCHAVGKTFALFHVISAFLDGGGLENAAKILVWEWTASYVPTLVVICVREITNTCLRLDKDRPSVAKYLPCIVGLSVCVYFMEYFDNLADRFVSKLFD